MAIVLTATLAVQDETYKAQAIGGIGLALATMGDQDGLRKVLELLHGMQDELNKVEALKWIGRALSKLGDSEGLRGALAEVLTFQDQWFKVQALCELVQDFYQVGMVTEAFQAVDQAKDATQLIRNQTLRGRALSDVAEALVLLGIQADASETATQALKFAPAIKDEIDRTQLLCRLVQIFTRTGRETDAWRAVKQAIETAMAAQDEVSKIRALSRVVRTLGLLSGRENATGDTSPVQERMSLLQAAWNELLVAARTIQDNPMIPSEYLLGELANELADAGLTLEATQFANMALSAGESHQNWTRFDEIKSQVFFGVIREIAQTRNDQYFQRFLNAVEFDPR